VYVRADEKRELPGKAAASTMCGALRTHSPSPVGKGVRDGHPPFPTGGGVDGHKVQGCQVDGHTVQGGVWVHQVTLGGDTGQQTQQQGQQTQQQEQQKKSEHAHETEADNINACSTLAGILEVDKGKQEQKKKSEDETEVDKSSASSTLAGTLSVDTRQQMQRQEQQKKSEDETEADKTSASSTLAGTMTWISCEPQKTSSLGEATIQKDTTETIEKDTMPTVTNQPILSLSLSSGVHQGTDVEENEIEDMSQEEEYAYASKESTQTCCKLNKETEALLPIAKRRALRVPALRSPAQSASSSMCGALRTHSRALRVPALSTLAQSASPTDKIEPVKFEVGEDVEACHKVGYLPRARTNTRTHIHTHSCARTRTHTYSHTHILTHTHTHTFMEARKLTHNETLEILERAVDGIVPVSCCIIALYLSCALSFAHAYVHTLTHTCTHTFNSQLFTSGVPCTTLTLVCLHINLPHKHRLGDGTELQYLDSSEMVQVRHLLQSYIYVCSCHFFTISNTHTDTHAHTHMLFFSFSCSRDSVGTDRMNYAHMCVCACVWVCGCGVACVCARVCVRVCARLALWALIESTNAHSFAIMERWRQDRQDKEKAQNSSCSSLACRC